jgi:hypothetical protein
MSTGRAIAMQRWVTLCGASDSPIPIVQSESGWLDALNARDLAIDVLILRNDANTGQQSLVLETAISPEGPWTALEAFNTGGYQHDITYYSRAEGATDAFERFVRWRLDLDTGTPANWETTFRICVVAK